MKTLVSLSHATTLSSSINKLPTSLQITMSSSRMTEYNSFANLSNIMESTIDPAKLRSEFLRLLSTRRSPEGDVLCVAWLFETLACEFSLRFSLALSHRVRALRRDENIRNGGLRT
ncbi:hypothetical protein Nepgr_028851 [Nepenthes gracilis]|uniref:Uncharacterized protein n=1 Tax=Nepenthes gracilis TaxID=150966 RepID=A0AAD3TD11_NEPGR|nr:hypothetical protein Nepgr_028851 [Nepenthes gracilis]